MAIRDLLETPGPQPVDEVAGPAVTVLTTDPQLRDAICAAVQGVHPVFVASEEEEARQLAAAGRCAVLITDRALTQPELARITKPLRAHEPALVTIAVGSRADDNTLIGLLSTGAADRFMLKPVMPALAKLAIRSAAREHQSLKSKSAGAAGSRADTAVRSSVGVVARSGDEAVAALDPAITAQVGPASVPELHDALPDQMQPVATSAERWRVVATPAPVGPQAAVVRLAPVARTSKKSLQRPPWPAVAAALLAVAALVWWIMSQRMPDIDPRQVIATNLANAQQALDAGRYLDPPERSALHYFSTVLALDPANAPARQGVERIARHFIERFKAELVEGRLAEAVVSLERVRRVRSDHPQLASLETQLQQELQRRLAARAQDSAAAAELAQIQSRNEAARLEAAKKVRAAQQAEIDNAAQEGLRTRVLADARQAVEHGQLDFARRLIDEAQTLGVPGAEIDSLNQAFNVAQQVQAKNELLQLVLLRTEQDQLLEPASDSAGYYLQRLVQTDRQYPGLAQGVNVLGARLVKNAGAAVSAGDFDLATRLLAEAREIGFTGIGIDTVEGALRTARLAATPAAEPQLVRLVKPEYPNDALMRGIEGWVDVSLLVTSSGNVSDVRVEDSSRRQLFERAALAAVRQWKYEARALDDPNLNKRLRARVQFRLKD